MIGLIVLAAVVRAIRIGSQSLWIDEIFTLNLADPRGEYPLWMYLIHNIHGPVHAFVVYLFRLFGDNEAWLRVPSALAGVVCVYYFYRWARAWIDQRVALFGALLLAVHPLHVHYSHEVRNYSFLLMFSMMACYHLEMWMRNTRSARQKHAVWYAASVALAVMSNFSAAFLFAVHTVVFFMRRRISPRTVGKWAVVCGVILVLISPWVYRVYTSIDVQRLVTPVRPGQIEPADRLRGETTFTAEAIPYAFYTFSVGFTLGPSTRELHTNAGMGYVMRKHGVVVLWVVLLFGSLFVLGAIRAVTAGKRWVELWLYLLIPLVLTMALNWQNAKAFNVRYMLVALPAFVCVLSLGITGLRPRVRLVAAGLTVATLLVSLGNHYFNGRYAKEDVRSAVRYVMEQPETPWCVFAPTVNEVVRHYQGEFAIHSIFQRETVPRATVDRELGLLFAACNSFWYFRARVWVDDYNGYLWEQVNARYDALESVEFDGLSLTRFIRKKDS